MTSRLRALVTAPVDPKTARDIATRTDELRSEAQKLSKIQDVVAAEAELKRLGVAQEKVRKDTQGVVEAAVKEAEALLATAHQEAEAIVRGMQRIRDRKLAEVQSQFDVLEEELAAFRVDKAAFNKDQESLGQDREHVKSEALRLHNVAQELKHSWERLRVSKEAHQQDLHALALREKKFHEVESASLSLLSVLEERTKAVATAEDLVRRAKDESRQALQQATARSQDAQERSNRAQILEHQLADRSRELDVRERELSTQERKWSEKLQSLVEREKRCLLREAQIQAGR